MTPINHQETPDHSRLPAENPSTTGENQHKRQRIADGIRCHIGVKGVWQNLHEARVHIERRNASSSLMNYLSLPEAMGNGVNGFMCPRVCGGGIERKTRWRNTPVHCKQKGHSMSCDLIVE